MNYRQLRISKLQVGEVDLGRATLTLQRDDPLPGVRGVKSWRVNGELPGATALLEDAELAVTLADGRRLTGRAFLTSHRIAVGSRGAELTYEYLGTGPLAGTTESDYD